MRRREQARRARGRRRLVAQDRGARAAEVLSAGLSLLGPATATDNQDPAGVHTGVAPRCRLLSSGEYLGRKPSRSEGAPNRAVALGTGRFRRSWKKSGIAGRRSRIGKGGSSADDWVTLLCVLYMERA